MKHISQFFDWLFHCSTPEAFPALFFLGLVLAALVVIVGAFVYSPLLGFLICGALFFGIPYVGYRVAMAREEGE
jgi:hypothetical protein